MGCLLHYIIVKHLVEIEFHHLVYAHTYVYIHGVHCTDTVQNTLVVNVQV